MKTTLALFIILFSFALAHSAEYQQFNAKVIRIVDGDTFKFKAHILDIDINGTCRMKDYNAPELHGAEKEEGLKAKAELARLIQGKTVRIKTHKKDKYGRWLCEAWSEDKSISEGMRAYLKDYKLLDKYTKRPRRSP